MISDFLIIFQWYFFILIIGVASLPLNSLIFNKFTDKGYAFTKVTGIALFSYLFLIASIFKILPFTTISLVVLLIIIFLLNIFIYKKILNSFLPFKRRVVFIFLIEEILFVLGLVIWSFIRGYFPDINGLEKFMDYGFINSILNSKYLPPNDMWFAGETINYYWFGHLATALLTKISTIPSSISYNLMIATILGLSLSTVFSIVFNFFNSINKYKNSLRKAIVAGLLSAFLVNLAGNFHTPYYLWKEGKSSYWYPDATRFIGYNPETEDKTIHEFPLYSYVVSDLHAHLLNLPFVILYIALLYSYVLRRKNKNSLFLLLPLGAILGIMFMTSTWDFGNYLILTGVTLLLLSIKKHGFKFTPLLKAGLQTLVVLILGLIFALPFITNFTSIAQGIDFVNARSPLWQLLILWGFPLFLTILFVLTLIKKYSLNFNKVKSTDLFVLSILISSWLLIITPEVIYVKDIYIASHHRANTMFKLTYQAYVMFYLSGGYIVVSFVNVFKRNIIKFLIAIPVSIIVCSIFIYPKLAINSYYRDLNNYIGLDGESWLKLKSPDTYNAILWIRNNTNQGDIVLEAPGESYTEKNVISSYTGRPTVSGWFVHEWLWRGDAIYPQKREEEINIIYTNPDPAVTKSFLNKYSIDYIIIGPVELEKFPLLNVEKFLKISSVVFTSPTIKIYKIN